MGTVIRFPVEHRAPRDAGDARPGEVSAQIIVLPVIRIERWSATEPVERPSRKRNDPRSV
jgi:hypothetical protein